ncbi:MAG: hypothetical protein Kow0090_06180 [Myxococcota bacterium]
MNDKKANNVKQIRERLLMSKAELARKAGLSPLTIDRVEQGMNCRMETKRKIILALGMKLADKEKVFVGDDEMRDDAEMEALEKEKEEAGSGSKKANVEAVVTVEKEAK